MTPQDHLKLNKAKCLLMNQSVKFKVIELLMQLKKSKIDWWWLVMALMG